jgi:hypothetical protein
MNNRSLFNEQGQLTDFGKAILKNYFDVNIALTLDTADNEAEARTMGSCLMAFVADAVNKKVMAFQAETAKMGKLWEMSDDEFETYLTEKYKDVVAERVNEGKTPFFSMNEKEVERYHPIAKRKMRELRDEMDEEKAKQIPPCNGVRLTPKRGAYDASMGPLFPDKYKK